MKTDTATLENGLAFSYKVNYTLLLDPAIPRLGVNLRKMKIHVHTKISTWIFIAALLIVGPN